MASNLKLHRRFIAACCMEMWEWVDAEGVTDEALHRNVTGVTLDMLREVVDVPCFADEMIAVGWIKHGDGDNHWIFPAVKECGLSSTKERSSNAERQARWRAKHPKEGVTRNVTKSVISNGTEERRGEESRNSKPPLPPGDTFEIPSSLQTPEFLTAWKEWQGHRKEIEHPLKPTTARKQLSEFEKWGIARSIVAIEYTIKKGWQGLVEPKGGTENERAKATEALTADERAAAAFKRDADAAQERARQRALAFGNSPGLGMQPAPAGQHLPGPADAEPGHGKAG